MMLATDRDHAKRRVWRAVVTAVIWSLGLACVAINLDWALLELIPREYSEHRDYVLEPKSGLFRTVNVRKFGYGTAISPMPRPVTRVDRGWIKVGSDGEFNFETSSGTCSWATLHHYTPNITRVGDHDSGPTDRKMLERWLYFVKIDSFSNPIGEEVSELLTLVQAPNLDPSHDQKLSHFKATIVGGTQWSSAAENQTIATVIWLALWCCGLGLIWRRARRRVMTPGFDVSTIPKPAALAADAGLTTVFRSHG